MRIDVFLRLAGILKTRSLAGDACDGGFVRLNGRTAKPASRISAGDRIDMSMPDGRDASFIVDSLPAGRQVARRDRSSLFHEVSTDGGAPGADPIR